MRRISFLAAAALLGFGAASIEAQPDHHLFVVGGYTSSGDENVVPDGVDNELDARIDRNLRSVLVADVDSDAKTVTNWRRAGLLPLEHPVTSEQVAYGYLYSGVSYLNGRIYVGPGRTEAGGVPANFVSWAEVNPGGSLGAFETSPTFPGDAGIQGQSAMAIVEAGDTHYVYVLGGRAGEAGGQTDRIIYAPIDSDTGAVGDWEVASITIPTTDWFNSAIGIDGTVVHVSGNQRGSMSADLIVPQANGDLVGGWISEVYSTDLTNRWETAVTTATDPAGDTYVYLICGSPAPRNRVDYTKFEFGLTSVWESSTFPVERGRPTASSANDMIVVPGGSETSGFGNTVTTVFIGTVATGGAVTWAEATEPMMQPRSFHGSIMVAVEDETTSVSDWILH